jgi:hypothetical protein
MKDLPYHLLLFVVVGAVIVLIGCLFSEADDRAALRILPKRLLYYFVGCAFVAAIMLVCEHTLARVG